MICDSCAWKDGCEERKNKGKHEGSCDGYLADFSDKRNRRPKWMQTPEDRRPPIETREEER